MIVPRVALKVAYDGRGFHGLARQPGLRTVEGDILRALLRDGAIRDPKADRFHTGSRTDRGVSAIGNVVAFNTHLESDAAMRVLNHIEDDVWAWAHVPVPQDFNARRAQERSYAYALSADHDVAELQSTLSMFQGEHDFRNFTRDRTRTTARIDVATAVRDGGSVRLSFVAPSFRWNLVRRLVAAALQVEAGAVSREDVAVALAGTSRADFGLAPPEPLTLLDISYGFDFQPTSEPAVRRRVEQLRNGRMHGGRSSTALSEDL